MMASGSSAYRSLPRASAATDTVENVRLSELRDLATDLECLDRVPHSKKWRSASGVFLSVGLGGLLGFVLLFDKAAKYESWVVPVYCSALGLLFLIALICWLACRDMDAERITSLDDVRAKARNLIESFDQDSGA